MTDFPADRMHLFERKLKAWEEEQHPPAHIVEKIRTWWPSLAHNPRRRGRPVPGKPGVRAAWVADCALPDDGTGPRGVQCYYRVENGNVICQFFETAPYHRDNDS